MANDSLALLNGPKAVTTEDPSMFHWPIVNDAMEEAVLDVLRRGAMSGTDLTKRFEAGYAKWHGSAFALGHTNGTSALEAAMFAVGVGRDDEVIVPSITYWASCTQVLGLGGKIVFADIDPDTLCIDPADVERRITDKTKAIVAVDYLGIVADYDRLRAIAEKHDLKIIEDSSHAHGSTRDGKLAGTLGDVGCFSLMSSKGFAIGEAGILITDDQEIYERAILYGHYSRHSELQLEHNKAMSGLPAGGRKNRMHQMSAAVGLVQLEKFPQEMAEIDRAMKYFWSLLDDVPGIRPTIAGGDSTMGAWYFPHGFYDAEAFGGLSVARFCEAVRAEGSSANRGVNAALHKHPLFSSIDVFNDGRPTNQISRGRLASEETLPITDVIQDCTFGVPWFKRYRPELIEQHAEAFRKVARNYEALLSEDEKQSTAGGSWGLSNAKS